MNDSNLVIGGNSRGSVCRSCKYDLYLDPPVFQHPSYCPVKRVAWMPSCVDDFTELHSGVKGPLNGLVTALRVSMTRMGILHGY